MSLIDDFSAELNQSVSIQALTGHDSWGEPQYATAASKTCYIEKEVRLIRDLKGNEVVSHAQIYLDGAVSVGVEDKVTFDGRSPPIIRVERQVDEKGAAYVTVVYT